MDVGTLEGWDVCDFGSTDVEIGIRKSVNPANNACFRAYPDFQIPPNLQTSKPPNLTVLLFHKFHGTGFPVSHYTQEVYTCWQLRNIRLFDLLTGG